MKNNYFITKTKLWALLPLFLFLFSNGVMGQSTATTSGPWSTAGTWTGGVPGGGTNVTINTGVTVTLTANAACGTITLKAGSALVINPGFNLSMTGNWTNNGGTVTSPGTGLVVFTSGTTIGGTASTTFPNLSVTAGTVTQAINTSVAGNYTQSAGTYYVNNGATAYTLTVGGNFNLSGGSFILQNTSSGLGATVTVNGATGTTISGNGTIKMDAGGAAVANVSIFQTKNYIASSTSTSLIDWGNSTFLKSNQFRISGNYTKTGTGSTNTAGNPVNGGYFFNGSGTQTFSSSATVQTWTSFTVNSGSTLQMLTALVLGTNTNPICTMTVNGTLDCQAVSGAIKGGAATGCGFILGSGGTLITANTLGVVSGTTGSISTSCTVRTFNNAANYTFNSAVANQATNFPNATMNNLTINNTFSGGVVTLGAAATINGTLAMTNGLLATTATNVPTVGVAGSVTGGSTTSFVQGPMKRILPASLAASATVYNFPVGKATTYLPYSLTSVTTSTSPTLTVEAFNTSSGGSADGTTLTSISATEYWTASAPSGYTSGSVSVGRQSAALGLIGQSATPTGTYASIGGTTSGNNINNSTVATGLGSFVMGDYTVTPILIVANPTTAVTAANICASATIVPIHAFKITGSNGGGNLTNFSFTTTGTYAAADITNFKIWYNSSNDLASASSLATNSSPAGAGSQTFPAFTRAISGTEFYWITMDVAATPTNNATITVSASANTNLTASVSTSGTASASSTQTLKGVPSTSIAGAD